jgi:hypothetical protein
VRIDPGPCPICGAEHSACTSDTGPIAVAQLPARDALAQSQGSLASETVSLALGQFSTATYRGTKGQKK